MGRRFLRDSRNMKIYSKAGMKAGLLSRRKGEIRGIRKVLQGIEKTQIQSP